MKFAYDAMNRLTNMVDSVGTTRYSYDAAGQLLVTSGPFSNDALTNTYSSRHRIALALQQPTGLWTNAFNWDVADRLVSVASPAGSFGYAYASLAAGYSGRLINELTLPNSAYITNLYDPVARLAGTFLKKSNNATLDSATYGYNLAGQRTTFTNAAGTYVRYSYDRIGQLKVATSSVSSENRGYAYDAAWNLNWLTNSGSASQFQVDTMNELTNAAGNVVSYDANGNPTDRNLGVAHDLLYTYDDENRLIDAQDTFLGWETVFVYDGLGRLRIRRETNNGGARPLGPGAGAPLGETHYVYDGWRVIQERDTNNVPQVSYTRGLDLSGTLGGAGGIGGLLGRSSGYSSGNWTSHAYYHADGNGNITYLVNSSQGLAASYRYDPFGNTLSSSGTLSNANVYRFSSKEILVNSGLIYYGYRFYDPSTQRWLNRDPVAERGFIEIRRMRNPEPHRGANTYQFVLNGPSNFTDPEGLTVWVCNRKTDWGVGNHPYFYDDDPEHGPSQSCSEQRSSGGQGTVNPHDLPPGAPPDGNPNCTPVEGTGDPGQDNERARAIMSCCEQSMNNGANIPGIYDCHNRLDNCLRAGGVNYPITHPRLGPPTVGPIFPAMAPNPGR